MQENTKSLYFIKLIFQYVNEKSKLKIVKYNKSLQKNINISIINFKFLSRRYIVYESIRIGKEYDAYDGKLYFEDEYLKGEKNGKGREYNYNGKLVFEGEYFKDLKWKGKVIEYYYDCKLKFEGEYLNGKKSEKGKEYYYEDNLKFEGEYLNEKRNWKGERIL